MVSFRFRKKTDYGLAMVALICTHDRAYLSASDMQQEGLPRSFIVKVAQDLIRANIIGSKEGRGGGYFLACDPDTTTVQAVVEALEGPVSAASCVHGADCPFAEKCPQKGFMRAVTEDIERVLQGYTIRDLC